MVRLIVYGKNSSPRQINVPGPLATIGRAPVNRVCIDSERVSRHHAVIQWSGDCWMLTDMGSCNGSFVNDQRVYSQELRHGDEIGIGDYQIRFLLAIGTQPELTEDALRLLTMPADLSQRQHAAGAAQPARKGERFSLLR